MQKDCEMLKLPWYRLSLIAGMSAASPLAVGAAVSVPGEEALQVCAAVSDANARLACFDQWSVQAFGSRTPAGQEPVTESHAASLRTWDGSLNAAQLSASEVAAAAENGHGCENPIFDSLNRLWELSRETDCGTFKLRAYAPQIVAVEHGNRVNNRPASPAQRAAPQEINQKNEVRIQISLRTKLASGLLTPKDSNAQDSIWAAYTQNSYWQLFNKDDSSPFRTTDHQPEIFYIYPTTYQLPFDWKLRYTGVGVRHHSNGQRDPWSRSWNSAYVMGGAEYKDRWLVQLKAWDRISSLAKNDDNPDVQKYWGNTEVRLGWKMDARNSFSLTARGAAFAGHGYGSGRLEWFHALGSEWLGQKSNLQFYVQLFSGYGESLIDYNFKRTTVSVGLSLLDF